MIYTTKENVRIKTHLENECVKIKVNIPLTEEEFENGNGEGMWCRCPKHTVEAIGNNKYAMFIVEMLNDSVYYPNLKYGDRVLVVSTGKDTRPIAPINELKYKYGEGISLEEKQKIIDEIYSFHMTRIKER